MGLSHLPPGRAEHVPFAKNLGSLAIKKCSGPHLSASREHKKVHTRTNKRTNPEPEDRGFQRDCTPPCQPPVVAANRGRRIKLYSDSGILRPAIESRGPTSQAQKTNLGTRNLRKNFRKFI